MKTAFTALLASVTLAVLSPVAGAAESSDPAEKLANEILAKMTLEEKISLCHGNSTMTINAIPRLGLKDEFCMSDGPNNVRPELARRTFDSANRKDDYSTSLPALSALAATWDPALATRFGMVIGEEARDRGKDMMLGPGVNMMRTPVCGRNFEYMGEDPALASAIVVPLIRAIQSNDVAACIKHYALNNQELNRNGVNVEIDERSLREIYLPAFHAAITEAGSLTLMNAYNLFRGDFCSHSDYLNNQILKKEWGFKGFVVTDWGSVHDTVKGALGGLDVEMNAGDSIRYFKQPLLDAVKAGKVPESVIDDKVRRVLYVMAKIHKIDGAPRKAGSRNTPEHQATAREVAESAIVLLKNNAGILPLDKTALKTVLVLGETAINKNCTSGWSAEGKPPYEISPLDGIKQVLGKEVKVEYMPLVTAAAAVKPIPEACLRTVDTEIKDAGMTIKAWRVEYFNNQELKGEPVVKGFDRALAFKWNGKSPRPGVNGEHFSARWTAKVVVPETGSYTLEATSDDGARLFVDGQQIINNWSDGGLRSAAGTIDLVAGKEYEIRAEYFQGDQGSGFSLGWRLPSEKAGTPAGMLAKAKAADAVLVFTGTKHGHGQALECEGGDRPNLKLPEGHDQAIAALLGANPKTVVVNLSGAPVEMPWVNEAKALVQYWYAGMEGGNALARILFGEVNPSGKLPFTFPVKLADSPAVALNNYNDKNVNYAEGLLVGYRWFDAKNIEPLFPFGYGLSYTTFTYGQPALSAKTLAGDDKLTLTVPVTNTGKRAGAEVVQLYIHEAQPVVPRPPQELKGFVKLFLQPGETKSATFTITRRELSFWDVAAKGWKANPGTFEARIGASSRDLRAKIEFDLK